MHHAYFVTGTDTDAGKTTISAGLLSGWHSLGHSTAASKPVASGCEQTPHGLSNSDTRCLAAECRPALDERTITPYTFEPAIAPHLAARLAGQPLSLEDVIRSVRTVLAQGTDVTLVEGAGGFRVPLNDHEDLSDLAKALELPVILVVGIRLGAINHARLSSEAIRAEGLHLAGWVANRIDPNMAYADDTVERLTQTLGAPLLGDVPYLSDPAAERVARYLSLPDVSPQNMTSPAPGIGSAASLSLAQDTAR
ncbi:dethiobiotin synthase [Larsenimonas salina]|uniref:dethiobiotin synthase n=1 Tax=Larsenimonas salina TaxID=1295565 RepID=UPI002072C137|nr:dethiobiotin synthase [Larsenimonas salina]MCM5703584.1 dethiobiotin synthase [Larsenimonas salina]